MPRPSRAARFTGAGAAVVLATGGLPAAASARLVAPVQVVSGSRIPAPRPTAEQIKAARDAVDRMTVQVRINGQGPFPFVIDTGADRTVLSSELALRLGLAPGAPVVLNDTGGSGVTPTARVDALDVGARTIRDVSAPVLAAGNLGAQGLLGIDSLARQRIVMDFRHGVLSVEPSRRWGDGGDTIVVRARSRYGQLVLVDAAFGGRPLTVIVDSGAQNTIGNLALERQVVGRASHAPLLGSEVISVSGSTTPARFAFLPRVRIGEADLNNVPIAFADLHTFSEFGMNGAPAMLLGMDVLRHFDRVVVDFGRQQVSFRLPEGG